MSVKLYFSSDELNLFLDDQCKYYNRLTERRLQPQVLGKNVPKLVDLSLFAFLRKNGFDSKKNLQRVASLS